MKVVITSATSLELDRIKEQTTEAHTSVDGLQLSFHVSGIGILSSCYSITELLFQRKPDLIIQVGIAGCFDTNALLRKVVAIKEEVVGDMGVEENGVFRNMFDMKFQQENEPPYSNRRLVNPWLKEYNLLKLDEVTGLTINEISTRTERIDLLRNKYQPMVESMEGAAFHYVCLQMRVPFIQLRATSNYVGERDKNKWQLTEAVNNLAAVTIQYLDMLKPELHPVKKESAQNI